MEVAYRVVHKVQEVLHNLLEGGVDHMLLLDGGHSMHQGVVVGMHQGVVAGMSQGAVVGNNRDEVAVLGAGHHKDYKADNLEGVEVYYIHMYNKVSPGLLLSLSVCVYVVKPQLDSQQTIIPLPC